MKTRVKRRARVKRTKRRYCRNNNKNSRYKRRSMRRNLKGGWGMPLGGKLEQKEEPSQIYGGWGEAIPV